MLHCKEDIAKPDIDQGLLGSRGIWKLSKSFIIQVRTLSISRSSYPLEQHSNGIQGINCDWKQLFPSYILFYP